MGRVFNINEWGFGGLKCNWWEVMSDEFKTKDFVLYSYSEGRYMKFNGLIYLEIASLLDFKRWHDFQSSWLCERFHLFKDLFSFFVLSLRQSQKNVFM
jgi:hypothetical protein